MSPSLQDCLGPRLHTGTERTLLPRFRERRKQARLLSLLAAAASVSQEATSKPGKAGKGKMVKLTKEEAELAAECESPWTNPQTVTVEGMREGQLLFRFGDTDGWESVAEPLGSVSYGQAWQCRRKSFLIAHHPHKAAEISFSFPLWDAPAESATASPGSAHDAQQNYEAIEACLSNGSSRADSNGDSSSDEGGSTPAGSPVSTSPSNGDSSSPGSTSSPGSSKGGKLNRAEKRAKLAAEKLGLKKAEKKAKQAAAILEHARAKSLESGLATSSDAATGAEPSTSSSAADALPDSSSNQRLDQASDASPREAPLDTAGSSESNSGESKLSQKERKRRRKVSANAAKSPPPIQPGLIIDDYFNDIGFNGYIDDPDDMDVSAADASAEEIESAANDEMFNAITSSILYVGKGVSSPDTEPGSEEPDVSPEEDAEEVQDPALSSVARDATAEASTSGKPCSKTGSTTPEVVQDPALSSAARDPTLDASTSCRPPSKTASTTSEVVQDVALSSAARDATLEASTSGRPPSKTGSTTSEVVEDAALSSAARGATAEASISDRGASKTGSTTCVVVEDAALSSAARDATAEASTSGRGPSKTGSTSTSKAPAAVISASETVSAEAYLQGLEVSVPPAGELVYQDGWLTRADDSTATGSLSAKPMVAGRSKGFGTPKDPPKAASKELPKHLQELPLESRQGKTPSPSSANGAAQAGNGAAQTAEAKRADAAKLEADPAVSLAQIKQLAAVLPAETQSGLLQQAVAAAVAEKQGSVVSDAPQKLAKRGLLWRFRRRLRRAWKTMLFPITWVFEAAWLKLRYQTLRTLYTLLQPGPPAFHASPRIAQLLATAKTAGPEAAVQMSKDLGWDEDGKHEDPLSDLPRWRLEALIGGPIRNMSLFRQALTAPAALPEGQELASYERLEFLGDAVLELAIREHLFTRFDMEDEGQLTLISQIYLTNNASLCSIARRMHLDRYMATSLKRHLRTSWTDETMLPDLLEALIGALYRDQGLAACKRFVRQQIVATTTLDPEVRAPLSRKSALISYVNTRSLGHIAFKTRPTRKVLSNGMNVSTWVTEVRLNGRFLARADGQRKACESLAAKAALVQLQSEEDDSQADEAK